MTDINPNRELETEPVLYDSRLMAVGFQSRSGPQQDHHLTLYAGKRTDNGREVMNSMKVNLTA